MHRNQKFKTRALVIFSVAKSDILSRTYMGVLLVQLRVALLQDVIWVANVFFDRHGLHGSTHVNRSCRGEDTGSACRLVLATLPSPLPSPWKGHPSSSTLPRFPHKLSGSYWSGHWPVSGGNTVPEVQAWLLWTKPDFTISLYQFAGLREHEDWTVFSVSQACQWNL